MENAVKAFYMAGAVVIAVLILAIGIYLFQAGSNFGADYESQKNEEQLNQFNSQFEVYAKSVESKDGYYYSGNTIFDIISLANLAYSMNEKNNNDNINRIEIQITGLKKDLSIGICLDDKENNILNKDCFFASKIENIRNTTPQIDMNEMLLDTSFVNNGLVSDAKMNILKDNIPINRMIYRYYFECTDIQYSDVTGKVNLMKFEAKENSNDKFNSLDI